ncbi:MAG: hypothetical protein EXR36_01095 [Betaproteobacteria bacterium]|nr:hypothetical protein [Betaproteobacteria bacterium]
MRSSLSLGLALGFAALTCLPAAAPAQDTPEYRIESAAQEITQLYWLADTAALCGWASEEDSARFKHFSLRFLAAHLNDRGKRALPTMVSDPRYESSVRQAAVDGASENCGNSRWRTGWTTYQAAAEENDTRY